MRIKTTLLLILLAAAHSSAAAADEAERLVLGDFPGSGAWTKVTDKASDAEWIREYVPAGQSVPDYQDMWVVQGFPKLKGMDPGEFLSGVFNGAAGSCESVRANGPKAAREEGLAVAYGQLYCGRQIGRDFGVNLHMKVISGQDALYVVQREFRVPPSTVGGVQSFSADQAGAMAALMNAQGEANQFLSSSAYVCTSTSAEPRCSSDDEAGSQAPGTSR